jgi:hypothetical protein
MADLECQLERSLEQQVVSFAALQATLLQLIGLTGASFPTSKINQQISDDRGNKWHAITHGCGVRFRSESHGIVVDAYNHLDEPRGVDVWRLSTFIRSLPIGTRCRYERELAGSSLEAVLERLTERGILERCDPAGLFRVR